MLIRETSDLESIRIVHGIRPELVDEVARLLVEAFARKFEYQLRPRSPEQVQQLVAGSLTAELGWVALDENGTVVAAAGIDVPRRRFSHISYAMLAREFGPLSVAPRWLFALLADVFTLTAEAGMACNVDCGKRVCAWKGSGHSAAECDCRSGSHRRRPSGHTRGG